MPSFLSHDLFFLMNSTAVLIFDPLRDLMDDLTFFRMPEIALEEDSIPFLILAPPVLTLRLRSSFSKKSVISCKSPAISPLD